VACIQFWYTESRRATQGRPSFRAQREIAVVPVEGPSTGMSAVPRLRRCVRSGSRKTTASLTGTTASPSLPRTGVAVTIHGSSVGYRQPRAGATCVRIDSSTCALYSTPSVLGTVSSSVSASAMA
jgi:hypothetical protein